MKSFLLSPFLNNALKPECRLSENLRPLLCDTGKEPFFCLVSKQSDPGTNKTIFRGTYLLEMDKKR